MKIPPAVLLVMAVLTVAAGTLGYLAGSRQAALSETDVINAYADRYVRDQGLDPGDIRRCHAVPGRADPVWLIVVCAQGQAAERAYFVGRNGELLHEGLSDDRPFAAPMAPEA